MAPLCSFADWINLTGAESAPNIAEITIVEGAVNVALEIYVDDVDPFERGGRVALFVEADGVDIEPQVMLSEQRTRIDRMSPFAGMIDPRTRMRVPGPPEDDRVFVSGTPVRRARCP